jgi:hypothetical protein
MKETLLYVTNKELVKVSDISEISKEGEITIDYKYSGDLLEIEIQELIIKKVNQMFEYIVYGKEND